MRKSTRRTPVSTRISKARRPRKVTERLHSSLSQTIRRPRFQCDDCNRHFSRQNSLSKHRDRFHPINGMKCELCGACFRNRSSIVKHIQTHAKTPVCFCTLCNETFTEFKALDKHVKVCRKSRRKIEVATVVGRPASNLKGRRKSIDYRGKRTKSKRIAKTTVKRLIEESNDCHVIELVDMDEEEDKKTVRKDDHPGMSPPRPTKPSAFEDTPELIDTDEFVCEVCGIKFSDEEGLSKHHHDDQETCPKQPIDQSTDGDICDEIDDFWRNRFWNSDRSLVYMSDQEDDTFKDINQIDVSPQATIMSDEFPALVAGSIIHPVSHNYIPPFRQELPSASHGRQDVCGEALERKGTDSFKDVTNVGKHLDVRTSFGFDYPVTSSASIVISDTAGHSMALGAVYYECIGTEFKTFTTRGLETENSSSSAAADCCSPAPLTHCTQSASYDDKFDFLSSFVNSPDVKLTNVRENSPPASCTVAAPTPEELPPEDKRFVCSQCLEQFETKSDLEVHIELFDHGGDLCFSEICYKPSDVPGFATEVEVAADGHTDTSSKESNAIDNLISTGSSLGYSDFSNVFDSVHGESQYSFLTNTENNICSFCGTVLPSFDSLMSHIKIHAGKSFKCSKCHKMFISQTDFDDHAQCHTKKQECHICCKMIETSMLKDHIRSHDPPEEGKLQHRKCDLCNKHFDSMQSLASHQYLKHVLPSSREAGSEVSYTCPHCRQQMQSKDVLHRSRRFTHWRLPL